MARERRQTWPASITVKARVRRSANTLEAREVLPGISRGGSAFGWFSQPGGASRAGEVLRLQPHSVRCTTICFS
jgi:hypothetical protein